MVDTGRDENVCGAKESVHSVVASLGVASDLGCLQTSAVDLPPSLSESSPSQPGGASVSNLVVVEVEFLGLRAVLRCLREPGGASVSNLVVAEEEPLELRAVL